ncbi:acyl carrier protein [Betaproteobacteria bacterium]|nr:acyl carrier protein [Betaproteobacteria bacterium]GHU43964.1 acyl carrier protein [Betaproteobacteria bacterium]
MFELIQEVKAFIIETLDLEDVTPADIDDDAPLFGEGLGLDSIDALELGVGLQKRYGFKLAAEAEETRQIFASVRALAEYIAAHRARS